MCLFSQAVRLWTSVCDETPATFLEEGLAGNMGASDVAAHVQLLDETSADWQQASDCERAGAEISTGRCDHVATE